MVNTLPATQTLVTDAWVQASWKDFLALTERPDLKNARFYYDSGWMRIETMPVGSAHGRDNSVLSTVMSLYGTLKDINYIASFVSASFRKAGERECQPDLAYHIDSSVTQDMQVPPKNNQPINVDVYGPPTLAIEISATTLSDDLGEKRLLYDRLGVQEYWVVNAETATVIAFAVADGGSRQIRVSEILLDLPMSLIEEALRRSATAKERDVNRWLLQQFS